MFERFRYTIAKNHALLELGSQARRDKKTIKTMQAIAGNSINSGFGMAALKNGYAANKYFAAAATFARIANASSSSNYGEINYLDWYDACAIALVLGGCPVEAVEQTRAEILAATR